MNSNNQILTGKFVDFPGIQSVTTKGIVMLVFTDALASGTNEYVPVTFLTIVDGKGIAHTVRPRDIIKVYKQI